MSVYSVYASHHIPRLTSFSRFFTRDELRGSGFKVWGSEVGVYGFGATLREPSHAQNNSEPNKRGITRNGKARKSTPRLHGAGHVHGQQQKILLWLVSSFRLVNRLELNIFQSQKTYLESALRLRASFSARSDNSCSCRCSASFRLSFSTCGGRDLP